MSARLTLERVSKSFSDVSVPALAGVDLDIPAGSCTAILGPSGSGKSTILRIMAGLDLASAGQVLLDGRDIGSVPPERRGMGMVFQRPLLFPHLSVLDNVAFADRVAGMPRHAARRNAERYLDMVQLGGYGRRPVGALSGGQEQRVAIARALAAKPEVLLLDEPFSALDPALRADMHALIDEIRTALSPTIVMVTHDREEASAVADRIAVLHEGDLLQHDTVDRVYNRPESLRVARLMGGQNEVLGDVADGVHVSPLGRVALSDSVPDGPGVLVVRQEAIGVRAMVPDAAASGAGGAGAADGTGPGGGTGAALAASPEGGIDAVGRVTGIRHLGPRRTLTISFGSSIELNAEVPPGQGVELDSRVAVTLPPAAVSVVPTA